MQSPSGVELKSCGGCSSTLAPGDDHQLCFLCLGWRHSAEGNTCPACLSLPREERERRLGFMRPVSPTPLDQGSGAVGREIATPPRKDWADYDEDDDRRVYEEEDPASLFADPEQPTHRYPLDDMPALFATAATRMGIPLPPSQPAKPSEDFTEGLASRARPKPRPAVLCPAMTPIMHYAKREWANPLSSRRPALGYGPYCTVQGWGWDSGVPPIEDGVRMCLLPSSSPWPGGKASLPSERDKLTAAVLNRCYANAAQVVALANNMAFLAGSLDKLTHERSELSAAELEEVQTTAAAFLRMSQAFAIDGGRSMCAAQVGYRHLWLGLSSLKEQEKRQLLDLPISTSSLFGPDIQALIERLESASKASAQLAPHLRPRGDPRPPLRQPPEKWRRRSSGDRGPAPPRQASTAPRPAPADVPRGAPRSGPGRNDNRSRDRRPAPTFRRGNKFVNKGRMARYIPKKEHASGSLSAPLSVPTITSVSAALRASDAGPLMRNVGTEISPSIARASHFLTRSAPQRRTELSAGTVNSSSLSTPATVKAPAVPSQHCGTSAQGGAKKDGSSVRGANESDFPLPSCERVPACSGDAAAPAASPLLPGPLGTDQKGARELARKRALHFTMNPAPIDRARGDEPCGSRKRQFSRLIGDSLEADTAHCKRGRLDRRPLRGGARSLPGPGPVVAPTASTVSLSTSTLYMPSGEGPPWPFRAGPPASPRPNQRQASGRARSSLLPQRSSAAPDRVLSRVGTRVLPPDTLVGQDSSKGLCPAVRPSAPALLRCPQDKAPQLRRYRSPLGRDYLAAGTRSGRGGGASGSRSRVLLPLLPGAQEDRWGAAHSGPTSPERPHSQEAIPYADSEAANGVHQTRGLDDISRPQGCLLPCSHRPGAPEVPALCSGREVLRVSPSPLRVLTSSTYLLQMRGGSSGAASSSGDQDPDLHRRLAHPCPVTTGGQGPHSSCLTPHLQLGVCGELGKEHASSGTAGGVPGSATGLIHHARLSFSGKTGGALKTGPDGFGQIMGSSSLGQIPSRHDGSRPSSGSLRPASYEGSPAMVCPPQTSSQARRVEIC